MIKLLRRQNFATLKKPVDPSQPHFKKEEIDKIFNPVIMNKLFKKKNVKPSTEDSLESQVLDEKLRDKIKEESHKYDFRTIKRKLTDEDKTYLTSEEISAYIRQPQI